MSPSGPQPMPLGVRRPGDVGELGEFVLLGHVQLAVDGLDVHRLLEPFGHLLGGHLTGTGVALDVVEEVDLAGRVVGAAEAVTASRPSGSQAVAVTCGSSPWAADR
ncbi:hypothetical protein [Streptomyces sp. NPDC020330]|uniref:hypothetical protein n=1 Tax=unclassified Streptomyces TaxID=2593676 RepID=UPI00378AA99B